MKKQSGFTLIELVIVVVILGFLAVTAIPKFIDLTDQAKQANIEGMAGGFATGISLARAQWEAEGRPKNSSSQNSVEYDGTTIYLTVEDKVKGIRAGYALSTTATAVISGLDCVLVWNNIFQQPPSITATFNTLNTTAGNNIDYYTTKDTSAPNDPFCSYYLKETIPQNSGTYVVTNINSLANFFTYNPANSSVAITIKN
ncbi:MAG: MSHA pilin protein MshB [Alteromonadaceae bacterium]|jgi:MSHA pilin protein MshB